MAPGAERTVERELRDIHGCLRRLFPAVARVATAVYDPGTDRLKTFAHSTEGPTPLEHYEADLADVPSLAALARTGQDRVVDDLSVFAGSRRAHSRKLLEQGYRSSYTLPLYEGGHLLGVLFFDSRQDAYFTPLVVEQIAVFGRLVGLALAHSFAPARLLESALRVASRLTHYRDPETRSHLDRMSRYARLIALALAPREGLSDEFVEFLLRFAPIHDVGKIAVPDRVLLKRGRLTPQEFEEMKAHVTKGAEIVDGILAELELGALPHVQVLRNVVLYHHEAVDGSGYPEGLAGRTIPIEARIVTVADVFDALTSRRPYKDAWPLDEAFDYLTAGAGTRFDAACVAALVEGAADAAQIRERFADLDAGEQSREGYTLDL